MTLSEDRKMVSRRRDFVDENRDILAAYREKMNNNYRTILGFGCMSPQSTFDAVLKDKNYFFLPLCFLQIYWELDINDNEEFILDSLKSLQTTNSNEDITDTYMAYVYAFCLCALDENDESEESNEESNDIIKKLANQCFPPALVTMGDGCIAHKNINWAISYYRHAKQHGYMLMTGRINHLSRRDAPFLKRVLITAHWVFFFIPNILIFSFKGLEGEQALYLDFYVISHHLEKYFEMPKSERIQKFNEQQRLDNISKAPKLLA